MTGTGVADTPGPDSGSPLSLLLVAGPFGLTASEGPLAVPARYTTVGPFHEERAAVAVDSGRKKVVEESYRSGPRCYEPVLLWGFIDPAGAIKVEPTYDEVKAFSEGRAAVRLGDQWGFVDREGNVVIKPRFDDARQFSQGIAAVRIGTAWSYVDLSGQDLAASRFSQAGDFSEGKAFVEAGPWRGYVDLNLRRLFPAPFEDMEPFHNGLARGYSTDPTWVEGFIDQDGKLLGGVTYEKVGEFSDGLAAVKANGLWGFINAAGRLVIPTRYRASEWDAPRFESGVAALLGQKGAVVIDRRGNVLARPVCRAVPDYLLGSDIPDTFMACEAIGNFHEGRARVAVGAPLDADRRSSMRWGFIDRSGAVVVPLRYDELTDFEGGLAHGVDYVFGEGVSITPLGRVTRNQMSTSSDSHVSSHSGPDCRIPPMAPPSYYRASLTLESQPPGATVYLVPLWEWQNAPGREDIEHFDRDFGVFKVPEGTTPVVAGVRKQTYVAVFIRGSRLKTVRITPAKPWKVSASLEP